MKLTLHVSSIDDAASAVLAARRALEWRAGEDPELKLFGAKINERFFSVSLTTAGVTVRLNSPSTHQKT